jgi:hypothetical protein
MTQFTEKSERRKERHDASRAQRKTMIQLLLEEMEQVKEARRKRLNFICEIGKIAR